MSAPLLVATGLSKTFPGLKALDDVSLTVKAGEIVALLGQNGSGKSTLVKLLAGLHRPDPGGRIVLATSADGEPAELHFIHQDLGLVGTLSTIENLDLDRTLGRTALLPAPVRAEQRRAEELTESFGASFDVRVPVERLTAAERAIVAIARAMDGWTHPGNVLVLDEPTASLHGDEVGKLFRAVREVAGRGAGVVFITHRLDEVIELADRVVALRDGKLIADERAADLDHDRLVQIVAGTSASTDARRVASPGAEPVLRARGLRGATVDGIDLAVHPGEVVGVSGVLGSGREEVASLLFGAAGSVADELEVAGRPLPAPSPRSAINAGVAYVPGDRHRQGGVMSMSARENTTLPRLRPLRRLMGRLDQRAERRDVAGWFDRLEVRPSEPERALELFSGGNQQKVVLAKWLRNEPVVLLLDEPTHGVDVGAKTAIFDLIDRTADQGAGVLICSSDAKELALVCDRVLVMRDGSIVDEVHRSELTEARLISGGVGRAPGAVPVVREVENAR